MQELTGITEAWEKGAIKNHRDSDKKMFGNKNLIRVLTEMGNKSCKEIENAILESLGDYDCYDDITLVTIKRLK